MAASSRRSTGAGGRERYRHQFGSTRDVWTCRRWAACRARHQVMARQYPHRPCDQGDHAQMESASADLHDTRSNLNGHLALHHEIGRIDRFHAAAAIHPPLMRPWNVEQQLDAALLAPQCAHCTHDNAQVHPEAALVDIALIESQLDLQNILDISALRVGCRGQQCAFVAVLD